MDGTNGLSPLSNWKLHNQYDIKSECALIANSRTLFKHSFSLRYVMQFEKNYWHYNWPRMQPNTIGVKSKYNTNT